MSPLTHLAFINVFIGDIQGGLGPFLGTWLAGAAGWNPGRVGAVTTLVGLASLALSGPAGAVVDRIGRPRLLLGLACGAILVGTLAILPARGFWSVAAAQFLASAGGTLVIPAVTALTLGVVGKTAFPRQQGRNQAFNHLGILGAAILIGLGTQRFGAGLAFWVLGAMAVAAILAVWSMPNGAWNGRRALGWKEDEPDDAADRSPLRALAKDRRLVVLALALGLFNLANGSMLLLIGQKLIASGHDGTRWTALYVIVAQVTMVPVALFAGSLADRRGRRQLLVAAVLVLPVRAVLSAVLADPLWLVAVEVLDGIASGIVGVAVPVVVADLTWGSGRTQTALGSVNAIQGIGGALSGAVGGFLALKLGWTWAFLALAVPAALAVPLVLWLEETAGRYDEPRAIRPPPAAAPQPAE